MGVYSFPPFLEGQKKSWRVFLGVGIGDMLCSRRGDCFCCNSKGVSVSMGGGSVGFLCRRRGCCWRCRCHCGRGRGGGGRWRRVSVPVVGGGVAVANVLACGANKSQHVRGVVRRLLGGNKHTKRYWNEHKKRTMFSIEYFLVYFPFEMH